MVQAEGQLCMTPEQLEAHGRALAFLSARYRQALKLQVVDSLPSPVYGFNAAGWYLFAVVESVPVLGATEHIAVHKISGEVRALSALGQ